MRFPWGCNFEFQESIALWYWETIALDNGEYSLRENRRGPNRTEHALKSCRAVGRLYAWELGVGIRCKSRPLRILLRDPFPLGQRADRSRTNADRGGTFVRGRSIVSVEASFYSFCCIENSLKLRWPATKCDTLRIESGRTRTSFGNVERQPLQVQQYLEARTKTCIRRIRYGFEV